MTSIPSVVYVSNDITEEHRTAINDITARVNHEPWITSSVSELFPILSHPTINVSLVVISVDTAESSGSSIHEILNTVITLCRCRAVSCGAQFVPKIAISVTANTDPEKLKTILTHDISGIIPRGTPFTIDEKELALKEILAGHRHVPKEILQKLQKKKERITTEIRLTPRQEQIRRLICDRGLSNKLIAKTLCISVSTVKLHISDIFKKYGVKNRTQLALFAEKTHQPTHREV